MKIIDLKQIKADEQFKPHKIIQQEEVEVVILAFEPGQGLPVHKTPVDVFFYIVEGEAEILVGKETKTVKAGSIVLSPANIDHTVKNTSGEDNKVMVVKTPSPGIKK